MASLKNNSIESCVRVIPGDVPLKFSKTLSPPLPCATQGRTGRCWMFSGLTTLRYLTKQEDEFSYAHLFYHDKVERYRQTLISLMDDSMAPGHRSILYKEALSDGGQWDLFVALVKKFGVMPRTAMPDTFHTNSSKGMNRVANEMLRVHERAVRGVPESERCDMIHKLVDTEVARVFADMLGVPPETFDNNDKPTEPVEFFKTLSVDLDGFVSIVHDPRVNETKWYELASVFDCFGKNVGWLTMGIERLEKLAALAITQENLPVWFGANIDGLDREAGIHDPGVCKYSEVWPWMSLDKRVALETFHRVPSHAMVLTGVHMHSTLNVPVRWQVDNSWGTGGPHKGKHVMTAQGFREGVFQVVIPKRLLSGTELAEIRNNARMVPPDDPLATLAKLL